MSAVCSLLLTAGALAQTAAKTPTVPVPAPITPNGTVVEDVIARVNDQIITRSDVERAQLQFDQEQQQNHDLTAADIAAHQQNLLRDLIDQQLLLSKGKELGINADAQVITQLDEIRKANHFATMEDLEKAAQDQGVSFEDFKANIRNNIISQQVVRDEVGRKLQLTHSDVDKYYQDHKADYTQQESVKLSEILIATPAADGKLPDDATVAAAKAKADDIAAKLKAGASFDELAKTMSNGPTAAQGGDLGEFKRGALAQVMEDKTFGQPVGTVTEPIRTRQGFVLLKVTAHTPGGVQPLADVEQQVEEAVYMQQMQPALRAYLTQLREDSYVDIKPGFVDSGASPKQTKPVFTAYAPPVAKKKPAVATEKKRFDRHGHVVETAAVVPAPAATPVAATPAAATSTSSAPVSTRKTSNKPQKREKIRFGQAPRETLPSAPGSQNAAIPTEVGSAQGTTSLVSEALPDPNAPVTTDQDPLGPHPGPKVKTRYAQHPEAPKVAKPKPVPVAAVAPTDEETATEKTQAAPLGLNGDTSKKKKKKDKTKHTGPKERMAEPAPAAPAAPIAPTANVPVAPSTTAVPQP